LADRIEELVPVIGLVGIFIVFVALVGRWSALLPTGVFAVGAAYTTALALRSGGVDPGAPLVAAGILVATECAYYSIGLPTAYPNRELIVRRLIFLLAGLIGAVLVGAVVLVAASSSRTGVGLEVAGAVAALLILFVLAAISTRTST
jgi:hypothetical protein